MTRQRRRKAGVIVSLCVCLAAGQVVLASGDSTNDTLYVSGSAAVLAGYYETNKTKQETTPTVEKPAGQSTLAGVAADVSKLIESSRSSVGTVAAGTVAATESADSAGTAGVAGIEALSGTVTAAAAETADTGSSDGTDAVPAETSTETQPEATEAAADLTARTAALDSYTNIGITNINGSYLNVRDNPSTDTGESKVIGKLLNSYACEILETVQEGEWYKIQSGSITGYVASEFILTGDAARERSIQSLEKRAVVNTETLNVRTEPSAQAAIWTQLNSDERYDVLQELDGWAEIELDTSTGFVSMDYVDVRYCLNEAIQFSPEEEVSAQTVSLRSQIVNYAMQFLGNRYVWGGESLTNGVDCSGFTMKVYEKFGISMSHYTGSQAVEGKKIDSSKMKPGDLIFYAKNGTINHVALYIGGGQVIHAASKKSGIKISTWNYRTPVKIVTFLND